jgi:hypothetical protein
MCSQKGRFARFLTIPGRFRRNRQNLKNSLQAPQTGFTFFAPLV